MLTFLYRLILAPLELIISVLFTILTRMVSNVGVAIVFLSVVVSIVLLPFYRRADAIQEEERDKQASMEHWVKHIKRVFKGDEQYMLLTTYYREMNYHPLYSLRSSLSLLLEIPFFIAAYHVLSGLPALAGTPFGPIADLAKPDALLYFFGRSWNLLPICMTVVNLLSGAVYSKGFPLSMKVQQYALTLVFLVLLYNRPAGLVLYWTMNNVFSLGKNLITKVSRHPKRDTALCAFAIGILFAIASRGQLINRKRSAIVLGVLVLSALPLVSMLVNKIPAVSEKLQRRKTAKAARSASQSGPGFSPRAVFLLSGILLAALAGCLIPMSVISASPDEFIELNLSADPMRFMVYTAVIFTGLFVLWAFILFSLSSKEKQGRTAFVYAAVALCALINYMLFSKNFGILSTQLTFESKVRYEKTNALLNLLVLALAVCLLWLIWKKAARFLQHLFTILALGAVLFSTVNIVRTEQDIRKIQEEVVAGNEETGEEGTAKAEDSAAEEEVITPIFRLSKTGNNVIVLMMDRMISGYLPYFLKEDPSLNEALSGFTWYPNTISFGGHTNFGSPALYGGYEYTPVEMNKRSDELLKDKHDEALKVMPVSFLNAGYEVTVCDPSLAGYSWIPKLSIYKDYPEIKTYNTLHEDKYARELEDSFGVLYEEEQDYNFVMFSVFRMVPVFMQPGVYDEGHYFTSSNNTTISKKFMQSYGVLQHLPDMTEITEDDQDTFLMMGNKTPHEDTLLQMPDYTPAMYVNNTAYIDRDNFKVDGRELIMKEDTDYAHYDVNMASLLLLGEWFEYMKENGVYDNTRIIIVADHGHKQLQIPELISGTTDFMRFNPMLLVKDFGAEGDIKTDDEFMTNADTPVLAFRDLISDPVNPSTGKTINSDEKTAHPQYITTSTNYSVKKNNGTTYDTGESAWWSVTENVFDASKRVQVNYPDDIID